MSDQAAASDALAAAAAAELVARAAAEPDPWPQFVWRWLSRGWRPFGGWMLDLILLRTALVPLWQITHGLPVEPVDWVPLTAFGATLIVARSYDKREGTA